ncbi:flagellar hook-basal body complex protein FliE [Methylocystis sp. MJC1]|uniref:flagellar hook-basal body complex protein FliE n=1 Tax=Methylocystis sp. MJC1 TaxID=2654282 RepID=UPI0013EA11B8|nr:flagellar hook-basal body complex protein FliE [Methylocystis sp. MJC1]MBU6525696.1 flagellar hook-basal body complex protein FliE [Methylocystis sp. MJC1]UZX12168.1 flagellar hook-basal body complex protein FliE [Methylocystis sp. MJC1]
MSEISALSLSYATAPIERSAPFAQSTKIASSEVSFGDVLKQLANEGADTIKSGESAAIAGVHGQASMLQVVDAVMAAERSLQTMIAVRDKVVNAYQEISKMAI